MVSNTLCIDKEVKHNILQNGKADRQQMCMEIPDILAGAQSQ